MSSITNSTTTSRRVILYARAAYPEGLEVQLRYLRGMAALHGFTDPAEVSEVRAWGIGPQALVELQTAEIVLVRDYHRLSRKVPVLLALDAALSAAGIRLLTPEDLPLPATVPGVIISAGDSDVMLHARILFNLSRQAEVDKANTHARRVRADISAAKVRRAAQQ